ncbi:hypothetical protein, partial [Mycobacterium celatum]
TLQTGPTNPWSKSNEPSLHQNQGTSIAVHVFLRWRHKYLISVVTDGLVIDRRRDPYSLVDAQLGLWVDMGVALHLHSGRHRFVLGGRDRRVSPATPLDVPPVHYVDAWLSEADFDELLVLGGRSAARGPASGEPTRCLLFPNPLVIQQLGPLALRKKRRLMRSLTQPQLFIDVDNDAIRVIDPDSNVLRASASVQQVTTTSATYRLTGDDAGQYFSTMPAMAVSVPGMQPLTIGCRDFRGLERRFSWPANVAITNEPPAYAVSAADWLTLTDGLGLAADVEDSAQ